jgi:hypothetical protein
MKGSRIVVKKKRKTGSAPPNRRMTVGIRSSEVWKDWLDRFAERDHRSIADLIDFCLSKYAEEIGFEQPPKR